MNSSKLIANPIIVLQEKGGVAKTFIAVHLIPWFAARGIAYRPVDLDATAGVLTKVYPPPQCASISPALDLLRDQSSSLPQLIRNVLAGERVVVDCGANTGAAWDTLFELHPEIRDRLAGETVRPVLIVPVTSDEKTVTFLQHYKQYLFPFASIVMVVVREYPEEKFPVPTTVADVVVDLPLAQRRLFTTYRARSMTLDAIATSNDATLAFERGLARAYLPQLHSMFSKIEPFIIRHE